MLGNRAAAVLPLDGARRLCQISRMQLGPPDMDPTDSAPPIPQVRIKGLALLLLWSASAMVLMTFGAQPANAWVSASPTEARQMEIAAHALNDEEQEILSNSHYRVSKRSRWAASDAVLRQKPDGPAKAVVLVYRRVGVERRWGDPDVLFKPVKCDDTRYDLSIADEEAEVLGLVRDGQCSKGFPAKPRSSELGGLNRSIRRLNRGIDRLDAALKSCETVRCRRAARRRYFTRQIHAVIARVGRIRANISWSSCGESVESFQSYVLDYRRAVFGLFDASAHGDYFSMWEYRGDLKKATRRARRARRKIKAYCL